MGEISTSGVGAKAKTNKEMSGMGYAPPVKPKGMKSSMRAGMKKPKIRSFSRSK